MVAFWYLSYRQREWGCNPYGATGAGVNHYFLNFWKISKK